MRIQSAATVRGKEHKPLLLVPPPPAGLTSRLTHAATASRLPKILDVCPE
jgi:hypothetical protein